MSRQTCSFACRIRCAALPPKLRGPLTTKLTPHQMPMSDTCPLKYADRTSSWECKCNASTKYGKVANHPCRSKKDRSRATQKLTNHYKGRDKGGRWVRGLHPALAAAQEASSHGAIGAS